MRDPEGRVSERMFPVRQPFAMKACERKAVKEAKRLYTGEVRGGEAYEEPSQLIDKPREFKHLVVDSMNRQPSAPSLGGPESK